MQQSAGSIQLKLYEDGINLCGTAKVTLPSISLCVHHPDRRGAHGEP